MALARPADDPDTEPECSLDSAVQTDLSDSSLAASALDFSDWFLPTVHATRITSPYGIRHYRLHRGIDVKVFKGDSIVAAHDGTLAETVGKAREAISADTAQTFQREAFTLPVAEPPASETGYITY